MPEWVIPHTFGVGKPLDPAEKRRERIRLKKAGFSKALRELALIRRDLNFIAAMRTMYDDEPASFYIWGAVTPEEPPLEVTKRMASPGFLLSRERKRFKAKGVRIRHWLSWCLWAYLTGKAQGLCIDQVWWTKLMYLLCQNQKFRERKILPWFHTIRHKFESGAMATEERYRLQITRQLEELERAAREKEERRIRRLRKRLKRKGRRICRHCWGRGTVGQSLRSCSFCQGRGWFKRKKVQHGI